jgi:tetratricopeptide (TPR) repeat protein
VFICYESEGPGACRAAIMSNEDVHGMTPLSNLLVHDFWGQNITLADSHKSYRPFTVLTYRLNYAVHGIDSMGYHAGKTFCLHSTSCHICSLLFRQHYLLCYYLCGYVFLQSTVASSTRLVNNIYSTLDVLRRVCTPAARLSAVLFCFHPVHVEAVASIVGRADCVCGLLFLSALIFYSKSVRHSTLPYKVARKLHFSTATNWSVIECALLVCAFVCALLASLAKELGITVFGLFVVLEVAEFGLCNFSEGDEGNSKTLDIFSSELKITPKRRWIPKLLNLVHCVNRVIEQNNTTLSQVSETSSVAVRTLLRFQTGICLVMVKMLVTIAAIHDNLGSKCFQCSVFGCLQRSSKPLYRVLLTALTLFLFSVWRLRVNGEQSLLYSWTVMENHIALLPTFRGRALSYAQCHFWYFVKLIFPRYLSFDYGYACIPVIESLLDVRNIFPLLVYLFGVGLCLNAIRQLQWTVLVAGAILVIPLVPALNILFPVGTTLAERLLFIPSAGICMMTSYFLCHPRMNRFWLASYDSRKTSTSPASTTEGPHSASVSTISCTKSATAARNRNDIADSASPSKAKAKSLGMTPSPYRGKPLSDGSRNTGIQSPSTKRRQPQHLHHNDNGTNGFTDAAYGNSTAVDLGDDCSSGRVEIPGPAERTVSLVQTKCGMVDEKDALVYSKILKYFLVPVCFLASIRILSRNVEWCEELSLYRSALDVCPLSVKALSNYASLTLNIDRSVNSMIAADLASQLYTHHVAARTNHAYAQHHLGNLMSSMSCFSKTLAQVNMHHGKAWGSIGTALETLAVRVQNGGAGIDQPMTSLVSSTIRMMAKDYIDHGIRLGYYPPSILHARGSIALAQRNYQEALFYLQLALRENDAIRATAAVSGSVHLVDLVMDSLTLNQLGNVYMVRKCVPYVLMYVCTFFEIVDGQELGNYPEALNAFEGGLALDPTNVPLHANLALITRMVKGDDASRAVYER